MTSLLLRELADFVERELGVDAAARLLIAAEEDAQPDVRRLLAVAAAGCDVEDTLRRFGRSFFVRLTGLYPVVFSGIRSWRELLLDVAPRVHPDLYTLQPDADFPSVSCRALEAGGVEIEYRSPRDLGALAEGMLLGCLDYFGSPAAVARQPLKVDAGYASRFVITPP